MSKNKPKVIVIVGPTASGKTDLGIFLAKKFNGEIVNADSRQIYREMDIATGKPKFKVQSSKFKVDGIRHHLFGIVSPKKIVTMALWKKQAEKIIRDILKRGKLPIVVGGTGLYVQALVDNLSIPNVIPNEKIRRKIENQIKKKGIDYVYQKLLKLDSDAKGIVQPNNPRRIIRAIEVCLVTGIPFTKLRQKGKQKFDFLEIGVSVSREKLYSRIDKRIDSQFASGLVEETKRLIKKYPSSLPAMSGIGYKEAGEYLAGSLSLEDAKQKMKFRTHDYARRQLVWFRHNKKIKWLSKKSQAERLVGLFLRQNQWSIVARRLSHTDYHTQI